MSVVALVAIVVGLLLGAGTSGLVLIVALLMAAVSGVRAIGG
jgi:hypothetical protein